MQIRSVNNAREKVRKVRNNAKEQYASAKKGKMREFAGERGAQMYVDVVKSYALEFAPMINYQEMDLWDETELMRSSVTFTPDPDKEVTEIEPEVQVVTVKGLHEFLTVEFPVKVPFEVSYRDTARGEVPQRALENWTPSFSQTDMVLMQLDNARRELGLYFKQPDSVRDSTDGGF